MIQEALKLCSALYRVTELFPKEEPLRFKLREASLNIIPLVIFAENQILSPEIKDDNNGAKHSSLRESVKQFDVLYAFIDIAKSQKWVNGRNFEILIRAYKDLEKKLQEERLASISLNEDVLARKRKSSKRRLQESFSVVEMDSSADLLNLRQKKLLTRIKEEGPAPPTAFFVKFSNVHPRTILRDIEKLEEMRLIKRRGGTRNREYYIAG
ncbi:MAG: hypothetical protein HYV65_02335 [Candidatus Spechtbacteria bacterium]|nr:hypothetical protein [Candidatus Spechtbacteria bacterium]